MAFASARLMALRRLVAVLPTSSQYPPKLFPTSSLFLSISFLYDTYTYTYTYAYVCYIVPVPVGHNCFHYEACRQRLAMLFTLAANGWLNFFVSTHEMSLSFSCSP